MAKEKNPDIDSMQFFYTDNEITNSIRYYLNTALGSIASQQERNRIHLFGSEFYWSRK